MAIPSQPQGLDAQQADGNILLTWQAVLNSTGYQVQRSIDGLNFTNLVSEASVQYVDPYPTPGIQYYYQVAAFNGSGTGVYSSVVSAVAAQPGEMSLMELRLRSQETADRVGSQFVTNNEWNAFLRLSMYELYDLLIGSYEDFNIAEPVFINTNGSTMRYELPTGLNYLGNVLDGASGLPAPRFYKLSGVDLGVNTSNNAYVTINRYDWIDRNNYVYPNSTSTIYGVYNMRYRVYGNTLALIPTPAGNQQLRLWYAPVLPALLRDSDLTTIGWAGYLRYPIVRAAKYALDKEEGSDTAKLDAEILFLKTRIEQMSQNRDQGQPDTISETRKGGAYGGTGWGSNGANGGW